MDCSISFLKGEYRAGKLSPSLVMQRILGRLTDDDQRSVWISTADKVKAHKYAAWLDTQVDQMDSLPLYGIPFSVKDNIDVEGEPTTAACPEFVYTATSSAAVVQSAIDAGAMYIGKTNLDQFATGLVGVRSPYGIARNPYNEEYIPGGSSAGAGVSVSTGMVSFAFGTDTGGSGRIPASYNGIVGLKPAPGQLSRRGLVYACRSIDTPTIFAKTASDTMEVFNCVSNPDELDPFCFAQGDVAASDAPLASLRLGVPKATQLKFFDNTETEALFAEAVEHLSNKFSKPASVDFDVLTQVNDLMFFGPLLAERDASVGQFVEKNPEACNEVVNQLITGSRRFSAADAYTGIYKIADTKVEMETIWKAIDVLMVPTVGSVYKVADIEADPLQPNFNNGYYTNFANPLGLTAFATPYSKIVDGVPWGVTFLFKPGIESTVASLADSFSALWHANSNSKTIS